MGALIQDLLDAVLFDDPELSLLHSQAHAHNKRRVENKLKKEPKKQSKNDALANALQ